MANIDKITLPDGSVFNLQDTISGYGRCLGAINMDNYQDPPNSDYKPGDYYVINANATYSIAREGDIQICFQPVSSHPDSPYSDWHDFAHIKAGLVLSTITPAMDGTASPGSNVGQVARGDHVHPTDTTRAAVTTVAASASIDSAGLITFKNSTSSSLFTLQLPIYNGGVS